MPLLHQSFTLSKYSHFTPPHLHAMYSDCEATESKAAWRVVVLCCDPDFNGVDEPQGLSWCCSAQYFHNAIFLQVFPYIALKKERSSKKRRQRAVERLRARYKSHWIFFISVYPFELVHGELSIPSLSMQANKI